MADLASVIIGGLIGFASAASSNFLTFRLNKGRDNAEYRREKLEELYLAIDEYQKSVESMMLIYLPLIQGTITWDQLNDQINTNLEDCRKHGGRETVDLLVSVYFPDLQEPLESALAALERFNGFVAEMKKEYKTTGKVREVWAKEVLQAMGIFDAATVRFKKVLIRKARLLSDVRVDERTLLD